MKREFIEDGMGFKTLSKLDKDQGPNNERNSSMNLKEQVKPTYGAIVKNGEEVLKGLDYQQKKNDGRLTRKQYEEKF
jgi:hypothetical protein